MSVFASLAFVFADHSAIAIHGMGNGLEMIGIHAKPIAAKVVELHSVWDRTDEELVRNTVRLKHRRTTTAFTPDRSVFFIWSKPSLSSDPLPATVTFLAHLAKQSDPDGGSRAL